MLAELQWYIRLSSNIFEGLDNGVCNQSISKWDRDFHHIDGDRSNNKTSNCQALHTKCHRRITLKSNIQNKQGSFF
jgi:hypothetical protein